VIDYLLFGVGLGVVVIVGSALAILITTNNRTLEREASLNRSMDVAGMAQNGLSTAASTRGIPAV